MLDKITEAVNTIVEQNAVQKHKFSTMNEWFSFLVAVSEELILSGIVEKDHDLYRKFKWTTVECRRIYARYSSREGV